MIETTKGFDLCRYTCLGEALRKTVRENREHLALIESNRDRESGRWTYEQLRLEAERVASLLQEHDVEPGDRCALLMSNQSKWAFSATSIFWAGGVLVPLDYKLSPDEQIAVLSHAKPKILITEWPIWVRLNPDAPILQNTKVFVTEVPEDGHLKNAQRWESKPTGEFKYQARSREDVACIVYSSGTGGRAKGCMLTHANYLAQAQVLGEMFPITPTDRYFSIIPSNHAIDFMCGYFLSLQFGAAVVHQRTLRPEFISSTMKTYGITHMAVVPMLLKAIENRIRERVVSQPFWKRAIFSALKAINALWTRETPSPAFSRRILKSIHEPFGGKIKLLFAGGAFVDPQSAQFLYDLGLPIVIGYGLTEAGTVLTVNDLKPYRSDTVGKPIRNVELEIRDKNNAGIGEVWVKGPTVMKGYLDDPGLTQETIVDGWLRTGDLGTQEKGGHVKLVGRVKNMIVTEGGKNIYPEDVEVAFNDIDGAYEHSIYAANYLWPTSTLRNERLILVVRPKDPQNVDALLHPIRDRNGRLADFKRVSGYVLWDKEFPRTASLKLKRDLLAQELREKLDRQEAVKEL